MKEIIDLTYDLEEGMPTFAAHWHIPFEITQLGRHGFEGRETRKVTFGTHTGTQIDAPRHFIPGGGTIENVSLFTLIGEVTILDYSHLGPNGILTAAMLKTQTITERMLFRFGWGRFWMTKKIYQDYPFFAADAAEYLVEKGCKLVGHDTPSPDDSRTLLSGDILGSHLDSPIHKILLGNNIALVEYLANMDTIRQLDGWTMAALPLRIKGADGSPSRVVLFK